MRLHTAIAVVLMMLFITTMIASDDDKPLERLGNEAAASADSLYEESKFIEAAKKYEEAYNLFIQAQEQDNIPLGDKIGQMLTNMVTSFFQARDYEETIRIIRKRLALDPTNSTFARQIAQIYERNLNRKDKAIEALVDFEKQNDDFVVRRTIARLKAETEDFESAVQWYQKAFEMRQDPDVLQNIALLHHRLGNTQDAIKAYENFIATGPAEHILVNVFRNLGRFYEDIEDEGKSIEYYERSNRLRFNRELTLLLLTKYFDRGDMLNAREKANQLLRENPNNPAAIYYTGLILFEQGRYNEAKDYFSRIANDRTYGAPARQYIESIDSM